MLSSYKKLQIQFAEEGYNSSNHRLFDFIFDDIEDFIIRKWMNHTDERVQLLGWRSFARKYQMEAIDEIVKNLPKSFAGIHYIPPLKALREIDNLPLYLEEILFKKLGSPMQPMAMDDFINVINNIKPHGVLSIFKKFLQSNPHSLPIYHLNGYLILLSEWEKANHLELKVEDKITKEMLSLSEYLALRNIEKIDHDTEIYSMVKYISNQKVKEILIGYYINNPRSKNALKIAALLSENTFNEKLFNIILTQVGIKECFKLLRGTLYNFPDEELVNLFFEIEKLNDRNLADDFLAIQAINSNSQHKKSHKKILDSFLEKDNLNDEIVPRLVRV